VNAFALRRVLAAAVAILAVTAPSPGAGQRLGLFFDEQAGDCDTAIESFGRAHVWVFAFVPPDSIVSGVTFRVVLPSQLFVVDESVVFPRQFMGETAGTLTDGFDVRFENCITPDEPLLILEFDVEDRSLGGPRPDLQLRIQGSGLDSTATVEPRFRICDPQDPLGEGRGVYDAPGVHATFNCTQRCGCTTAVLTRRWGQVKALFR